ncbi:hypothetical protein F511_11100 [Dorcoceras hygrometricum]|uniref:Uncharacterized protein n=1 Tax=Dorcoceras hygrometricum TaxID=472368 RepID=A0A2Z7BHY7_9LAMI|nr:hypothetical protein F511_11100 [Dorcoceras hygrometricum]
MGSTDPRHKKQEEEYEVKPQYEEHSKSINHIRQCNISIVQCMKGLPRIIGLLAEAPLCPARLPAAPAMGSTDPRHKKQEEEYEVKPQYEEHSKSINHIRQCNISIVQCMKGLPRIIGRQIAQRLNCADIIDHHHLVIFRCDYSADHHKAVWYSGTTTQLATTSKQRWTFHA